MPVKPQQRREYKALCKHLADWRLRAGLSQRGLSTKLGRPVTYASKIESRDRRIDPAELADWARACGIKGTEVMHALGID